MRQADLRREVTSVIAKPASAPCMILMCGTWYGCVGVWVCVLWWDERCDGLKKRVQNISTGLGFDWILLALFLIDSSVDFRVFVLFLEAVGVREYCCMAAENRLAALCFARSSRAMRASLATNLRPSGLVALGLAESRQSYVRGVALRREPPKLEQA